MRSSQLKAPELEAQSTTGGPRALVRAEVIGNECC